MSPVFDCIDPTEEQRDEAFEAAVASLAEGRVVVLPTDTVYGVAADPFHPDGVPNVLAAKRRTAAMPPPVLVPNQRTLDGLGTELQPYVKRLVKELWPGPLTIVVQAQPSLSWDLGDTNGTVALRMPDHDLALRLLARTGPLAVTSANITGQPAATSVLEAATQLGPAAEVYLDAGPTPGNRPSTILDCTRPSPVILRLGALSVERLEEVLGEDVHLRLSPSEPEPEADREALAEQLKAEGRSMAPEPAPQPPVAQADGTAPGPGVDPELPPTEELDEEAGRREEEEQLAWLAELERQERAAEDPADGSAAPDVPEDVPAAPAEADRGEDGIAQAHAPTASTLRTVALPVDQNFDIVGVDTEGHEIPEASPRTLRGGHSVTTDDAPDTRRDDDRSTR